MWDVCPAAGRPLLYTWYVRVETHRGGLYGAIALSGVSNEDNLRVPPRSQDGLEGV